jgi:hypothetical protein
MVKSTVENELVRIMLRNLVTLKNIITTIRQKQHVAFIDLATGGFGPEKFAGWECRHIALILPEILGTFEDQGPR